LASSIAEINAATSSKGVYAVANAAGTGISFQGANSFSVTDSGTTPGEGVFGSTSSGTNNLTATAPTQSALTTSNGTAAITAIDTAITNLGLVQGSVGAGENKLQYASNLASSQITSYSAAESQIRDADVAAQAANLTKAQVLVQTSVAALAQANSAPQSILKLLQ
jgi:flagellin